MTVLQILRANTWLARRRIIPLRVADIIAKAVFSEFTCRVTQRHATVPRVPFCFRCDAEWPTWEQVPERSRR